MNPYQQIIQRIQSIPPGREQIALLEELVRMADANSDLQMGYPARRQLAEVANAQGFPEKAILAFSWCLSKFDENEELDHWHSLLWQYKVILEMIPVFPTVSREQIIKMQEDMGQRLAKYGETERTAHYYRAWNYMRMGDYDQALYFQNAYIMMPRSPMSDCLACERDRQVELLSRMKMDAQAIQCASEILAGTMSCGEVPEFTNAHIIRSYLRTGDVKKASKLHKSAYKRVYREMKYLGTIGDLMLVLVRTRSYRTGLKHLTTHLPWALESAAGELRFRFFAAAGLLVEALAQDKPKPRKLLLPKDFELNREDDLYSPSDLAAWFKQQAQSLADQFDARNQNDRYQQILAENRELAGLS